jgi:hypothetical protein
MTVDKQLLLSKIAASEGEVVAAEERLVKVLGDTQRAPRADKTTITETVKEAISKLRQARADLAELGELVSKEKE